MSNIQKATKPTRRLSSASRPISWTGPANPDSLGNVDLVTREQLGILRRILFGPGEIIDGRLAIASHFDLFLVREIAEAASARNARGERHIGVPWDCSPRAAQRSA